MPDVTPADLQVAEDCYMIGRRNPDSVLQCNTYLRTFRGGGTDFHWCMDPGSMMDYAVVRANLLHRIGEFAALPRTPRLPGAGPPLPQMGVGVEETGAEPAGYWLG